MRKKRNMNQSLETQIVKVEQEAIKQMPGLSGLVREFLAIKDVKPISKQIYKKSLDRFIDWVENNQVADLDLEDILAYKQFLKFEGLAQNTINLYLTAVKSYFIYLESKKIYPNVAAGVKCLRKKRGHLRESPTADQVKDMLLSIDISGISGKRDYAMINLMARTGLRTHALVESDIQDIQNHAGITKLWYRPKGHDGKDDFVTLKSKTLNPIQAYLKARGKVKPEDPIFISNSDRNNGQRLTTRTVSYVAKNAYRQIGIDKKTLTAHSLRHFFGTQAAVNGAPDRQIQATMGHADIQTTQIYIHNIDRVENAAENYVDF